MDGIQHLQNSGVAQEYATISAALNDILKQENSIKLRYRPKPFGWSGVKTYASHLKNILLDSAQTSKRYSIVTSGHSHFFSDFVKRYGAKKKGATKKDKNKYVESIQEIVDGHIGNTECIKLIVTFDGDEIVIEEGESIYEPKKKVASKKAVPKKLSAAY